jgi:hypothetical protein
MEIIYIMSNLNSLPNCGECIGSVMDDMLASSVVDLGFEPWSSQTKDYKIGICCLCD